MQRIPQIYRLKKILVQDKNYRQNTYLKHIREFYETLFKIRGKNCDGNGKNFHVCWYFKTLEKSSKTLWERFNRKIFYTSLWKACKMKSPGNDGLTKKLYDTFWNEFKETFVGSVSEAKKQSI